MDYPDSHRKNGKHTKILAVDDRRDNLYVIEQLLKEHFPDCIIFTTTDPMESLRLADQIRPAGILIDVQMPLMDGFEVCRRLKSNENTCNIPAILITAHKTTPELFAHGLEIGADDFIQKPINNIELIAKIKAVLRIRKAEDDLRAVNRDLERLVKDATEDLIKLNDKLRTEMGERIKIDEELQVSNERYIELFDNMSNGVVVFKAEDEGRDFIIQNINSCGERIEKVKKEDLIGKSAVSVFPGIKEFGLFGILQEVWKTGKPQFFPVKEYKDNRVSGWRENYVYRLSTGEVVTVYKDVTEQKKSDDAFRNIVKGTASHVGEDFFFSLTKHLASALQVKYAVTTKVLDEPPTKVKTLAFWNVTDFGENFVYDLESTPCENVLKGNICCYQGNVQRLFPDDDMLMDIGAESYLGMPIQDSSGTVHGHLAVIDDKKNGMQQRKRTDNEDIRCKSRC
ncbi:response regulator [candidate division KSB1 bacterium]